jgi:hypothetical protein
MTPTEKLYHLNDDFLKSVRNNWFGKTHPEVSKSEYEALAADWFLSSANTNLIGVEQFPYTDAILGCTHYIDSLLIKHHNQIQVLPYEYAYYRFMGVDSTSVGQLTPNIPLIVSLPNWYYADVRPDWSAVLDECADKNIDVHIDMAWITACRDIVIDVGHPAVKSFAMSVSKLSMEWNRIGLRWSRQRTMDSITVFNHYQGQANAAAISCGAYIMQSVPRDYAWNQYRSAHFEVCKKLALTPTRAIHVAHHGNTPVGIADLLLGFSAPVSV